MTEHPPFSPPQPLTARAGDSLSGTITVPGDKSISHRTAMFGLLAVGETRVEGLLEGEDVRNSIAAIRKLGGQAERDGPGVWRINGVGIGGLREPDTVLEMGNSGTSVRLLMGLAGSHPIRTTFAGDASLHRRPMARVATPLGMMGIDCAGRQGMRLPLTVTGPQELLPIRYELPVASAQVKSAILLAGLNAAGITEIVEPEATRDHTETMLRHMGADISCEKHPDGGQIIRLTGQPELRPAHFTVPGDPSSAAFPIVAALLIPGSAVTVTNVCINPLRAGLFSCLAEMGADISLDNQRQSGGETIADITARGSTLRAITPPPERAASMIDEYPILAIAAACAEGTSSLRGLAELRVKESDRLAAMAQGLSACGVKVTELEDGLVIEGRGGTAPPIPGGATIATQMDHRIAMSFLVAGLAAASPITIDDSHMIATSFPDFVSLMHGLGASIEPGEAA